MAGAGVVGRDIALPAAARLGWYDLTRDAWDTHAMLDRFGLLTVNPGEVTTGLTSAGKQRFQRDPHRFELDDMVLGKPGHPAVLAAVAAALDDALDASTTSDTRPRRGR